jgi:hypothetical protein
MASQYVLAVGSVSAGQYDWRVTPPALIEDEAAAIDAVIDELYGKPGLGVEDSAGLFDEADPVADAYELGMSDQAAGRYKPPTPIAEHDAYIRGQNDAWAAAKSVNWWRREGK